MPKVNDLKAYTRDVFTKAGLGDEALKQVIALMEDEKTLKALTENFKPLPDYSHDLDDVRTKAQAAKDAEYKDWYDKEQQKYQEYVNSLAELETYRKGGTRTPEREGNSMTEQELDRLVEAKLKATMESTLTRRDQAYLAFRDADFDHMRRFNKPMDRLSFEKTWKEHPEWGGDLYTAYEKWVAPEVEKQNTAMWEEKIKLAREEGIRDGFSRKQMPTDHSPKEFSPLFDRKEDIAKLDSNAQDRHSKEAFFAGLMEKTT